MIGKVLWHLIFHVRSGFGLVPVERMKGEVDLMPEVTDIFEKFFESVMP
jgi:hypothetical protein